MQFWAQNICLVPKKIIICKKNALKTNSFQIGPMNSGCIIPCQMTGWHFSWSECAP